MRQKRLGLLPLLLAAIVVAGCTSTDGGQASWTFGPAASAEAATGSPEARASLEPSSAPSSSPESSGDGQPEPASASPVSPWPSSIPAAGVDPRTDGLEIGFGEWAVTPEATVIRPGRVTFLVRNGGELRHGFELETDEGSGRHGSDGDDEREIESEAFASGTTLEISTTLQPGTYEIYCWIGDHEDRGMRTRLVVREDAPLVTPEPASSANEVEIAGFAFGPAALRVPVGTEVTWTNSDPTPHTVTSDSGSFASPTLDAGAAFAFRFDAAGTYSYICQIHPSMKGSVVVAP